MCNLDITGGHCNGTRYNILEVKSNFIIAQKLNRAEDDVILIPKILRMRNETDLRFSFTRLHFPVMLAYYMIFNRSQYQSVENLVYFCLKVYLWTVNFTLGYLDVEI